MLAGHAATIGIGSTGSVISTDRNDRPSYVRLIAGLAQADGFAAGQTIFLSKEDIGLGEREHLGGDVRADVEIVKQTEFEVTAE